MGEGSALSSSTSSLTLVAVPPLVDIVRAADLPDFLKARNISTKDNCFNSDMDGKMMKLRMLI